MVLLVKGKLAENIAMAHKKITATKAAISAAPLAETTPIGHDTVEFTTKFLMSDNLISRTTPEQRKILKDLYENQFLTLAKNKVSHPTTPILSKGALLHGENYDPKVIDSILKDGLISIDLGKTLRKTENSQTTIGGIDTWVNDKQRTINEYFNV